MTAPSPRVSAAACRVEAERRRLSPHAHQRAFAAVLDTWADNFDRRTVEARPAQPDLFA